MSCAGGPTSRAGRERDHKVWLNWVNPVYQISSASLKCFGNCFSFRIHASVIRAYSWQCWGPTGMLGIELGWTTYKAHTFPAMPPHSRKCFWNVFILWDHKYTVHQNECMEALMFDTVRLQSTEMGAVPEHRIATQCVGLFQFTCLFMPKGGMQNLSF